MSRIVEFIPDLKHQRLCLIANLTDSFYVYVDVDELKANLDYETLNTWWHILVGGDYSKEARLDLSEDTSLTFMSPEHGGLRLWFDVYGSRGLYATKYIPEKVHKDIFEWLSSVRAEVVNAMVPLPPRRSSRLQTQSKRNYKV